MAITKDYPNANWATAVEVTVDPRIIYPFKQWGDTSGYIVERDYVQARDSYSPSTLGTTDATYTSAYLVEETIPQTLDASLVKFTRRWGTVPSSFEIDSFEAYTFPGYFASYDSGGSSYRAPVSNLTPVTEYRTFMYTTTPDSSLSITGQQFRITKAGQFIDYVDNYSSPTYASYLSDISSATQLRIKPNQISRAYGQGNVWMQQDWRAVAQ